MLTLLLDTCTERGFFVISRGAVPIFEHELPFGHSTSKHLLPALKDCLDRNGFTKKDFSAIAVGVGPGSYTGIRIGVSVAKTLAFAWGLPLLGVCSLKIFSPVVNGLFATLIDAKMGGVYLITGEKTSAGVSFRSEPMVCPLEALGSHLSGISHLLTPNSVRIRKEISALYPEMVFEWVDTCASSRQFVRVVSEDLALGRGCLDGQVSLMYLRKTQAELEKESRTSCSSALKT